MFFLRALNTSKYISQSSAPLTAPTPDEDMNKIEYVLFMGVKIAFTQYI